MNRIEFYDNIYKRIKDFSDEYVKDETPRTLKFTLDTFKEYSLNVCNEMVEKSQAVYKPYETIVEVSAQFVKPQVFIVWVTVGVYLLKIRIRMDFKEKRADVERIKL